MDDFKLNRTSDNQKQNSFDADITKLQKQFNELINQKDFPVDKILMSLQVIENFDDLQKAINKEVNKKLSPKEIIKWEPIKFLFLTEKNTIQILNIISTSKQKLDETKSKMIYPNIKKILLKNDNDATNLIKYIQKEQIMYFDNKLLEQIPIDNTKKFTPAQIDCLNPEQFEILLGRKDCSEYICNNIGFRELPAHQASIISKLPYEKIAELTEDEINSLHQDSVKIILKRSYDVSKIFQTSKQFNALSDDKELTEKEKDLRQNLRETVLIELYNFHKTLQTSDKFQQLRSLIPQIVNTDLQKMKNQNATTQQIIENLDYLIYHIGQEQIKDLDDYVLTNLPKELILKFNSQQVKNFSSAQCLTLLKREDCSDYIINNLTAEQIYNMDLQNILTLPSDTIKKFVTKHQKFLFVNDIDDYLNNLGIDYGDKNNPESRATQYSEEYPQKCQQFNTFRYNIMLLIENLLVENDFTDLILPMLKSYHFSKLSKETLKKLINSGKLDLQKQNISVGTLKKWFDEQISIYPSREVNGEWICDRLQDLTTENCQLALKLINQFKNSPSYDDSKNKLFIVEYMITLRKKGIIFQIQYLNDNFAKNQQNDQIKTKLKELINTKNLQHCGQEIVKNLSTDLIKLLAIDKIELLIQYGALKYFSDDKIIVFDTKEISQLSVSSIENLIKTKQKQDPVANAINKFFDTYISCFTRDQLKALLKNGDGFLESEAIQKIKPETLFSDNEDDRKNILWKIDVMHLDFSKFGEPFYKNNFLTLDTCKKFSDAQIKTIIQSEKIKYLDPKFLIELPDEKIKTFNTTHLTDKQILALIKQDKFKYLNSEIISNTNMKNCLSNINSSVNFSEEQQKKLIDSELFLDLKDTALENFDSNLILNKLNNTSKDKKFMQNESLTKHLIKKNKIYQLDASVLQSFAPEQIKILSQDKNLELTDKQINVLLQKNYISYFDANFVASKLTDDQVKQIKLIINNDEVITRSNDNLCITIDQLIALSNHDKFCHIPAGVLGSYLDKKSAHPNRLQSLNLKNATVEQINTLALYNNIKFNSNQIDQLLAHKYFSQFKSYVIRTITQSIKDKQLESLNLNNVTAEQINILFKNNNFRENQIGQLLQHKEFAKINSDIIKKIGTNITQAQLQSLNLENATAEQINILFANNNFSEDQIGQLLLHKEFAEINSDIIKTVGKNIANKQLESLKSLNLKNATASQINILFKNNDFSEDQIGQLLQHEELANIDSDIIKTVRKNIANKQLESLKNLNLKNATASQINILFANGNFSKNQIGQLLQRKELANIDSDIIEKIGTNITIDQWTNLNFKNMKSNQLENFFTGCKDNVNLEHKDLNQLFNDSQSIDDVIQSPAFQEFYLNHVAHNNNTNTNKLDDIILLGKKSNFAKDKIFLRIVQHKLSISENQTNASQTNNSQKPIDPHMRKAYKKFIETLDNEDIKKFDLTKADKSLVDLLSIEKLLNLEDSIINSSEPIRNKLVAKRNNIQRWINFWNHVPFIGRIYKKFKSPLLENIDNKLNQHPESRESNPELNKTQKKIEQTEDDRPNSALEVKVDREKQEEDIS